VTADRFGDFFKAATTGRSAYAYQCALASERFQSRLVHLPTGCGKTAAALLAWLWRRSVDRDHTPRRLVYYLPIRVLVEQGESGFRLLRTGQSWTK